MRSEHDHEARIVRNFSGQAIGNTQPLGLHVLAFEQLLEFLAREPPRVVAFFNRPFSVTHRHIDIDGIPGNLSKASADFFVEFL